MRLCLLVLAIGLALPAFEPPADWQIRVVDRKSQPIAGVEVSILAPNARLEAETTTDLEGRAALYFVWRPDFLLSVRIAGVERQVFPLHSDSERLLVVEMEARRERPSDGHWPIQIVDWGGAHIHGAIASIGIPGKRPFVSLEYLIPYEMEFGFAWQPGLELTVTAHCFAPLKMTVPPEPRETLVAHLRVNCEPHFYEINPSPPNVWQRLTSHRRRLSFRLCLRSCRRGPFEYSEYRTYR